MKFDDRGLSLTKRKKEKKRKKKTTKQWTFQ